MGRVSEKLLMIEEPKNKIALRATLRHAFLSDRPKKCKNLYYFGSNWVKIYDVLRKLRRSIWQIPAKRLTRCQQFRFYSRKFSSWGVGGGGWLGIFMALLVQADFCSIFFISNV